jgi:hypothetical protein
MGSMNTLRYTSIALMLSTTMLGLLLISLPRHRPPHQPPCVLTSPFHINVSNETSSRRRLSWLTTQLGTLWLAQALLKLSSMNDLTRVLSSMAQLPKSSGSSQSSTCASPIHKLPRLIWNLATYMESGLSLLLTWPPVEVAICHNVGFAVVR